MGLLAGSGFVLFYSLLGIPIARLADRRRASANPAPPRADLFSKNDHLRALAVYAIGTYLGVFVGCFIGGYINQHYGWRVAFYTAGLPGIALAAVLWLTMGELIQSARPPTLSFCFYNFFSQPTSRRPLGCWSIDQHVIYITDSLAKNRPKPAERNHFAETAKRS